jgi:hypothetical protein
MTQKGKKKQAAVPYEFIQEVNKMSKDEIVRRFIQEENDLKAMKEVKREDEQISGVASQIKEKEEIVKEKINTLKEEMKAIREEDQEFVELKENKKALEDGYRGEMKRRRDYRDYLYDTMQRIYRV